MGIAFAAKAGLDVGFPSDAGDIRAIVSAVAPEPVNILIGDAIGLTMRDAAELGARRVSVGGAFARVAWGG